jgi:hypothetical protein
MRYPTYLCVFVLLLLLTSGCQADNTALGRVQSLFGSYQAGDAAGFEGQLTNSLRRLGVQCPDGVQYGCLQLAYRNFASGQAGTSQAAVSFNFLLYGRQTDPNVRMVLVEGRWGGSPSVVSCQVFFVSQDGSGWLVDNFDDPQAMSCQQRSDELTRNLFGPAAASTPAGP